MHRDPPPTPVAPGCPRPQQSWDAERGAGPYAPDGLWFSMAEKSVRLADCVWQVRSSLLCGGPRWCVCVCGEEVGGPSRWLARASPRPPGGVCAQAISENAGPGSDLTRCGSALDVRAPQAELV